MKTTIITIGCISLAASIFAFHDHMGWIGLLFTAIAAFCLWFAEAYKATQIDHQPFEFECNGRVYWFKSGHVYDDEGIGEVNDAWVIAEGWKQLRERKQQAQ
jgi:hypothetical protein